MAKSSRPAEMGSLDHNLDSNVRTTRYRVDPETAEALAPLAARATNAPIIERGDWRALRESANTNLVATLAPPVGAEVQIQPLSITVDDGVRIAARAPARGASHGRRPAGQLNYRAESDCPRSALARRFDVPNMLAARKMGTAKFEPEKLDRTAKFTPITFPLASNTGPPDPP